MGANPGRGSPSAARSLLPFEVEQLASTALSLPGEWVVVVEPPHGQLAITPERQRYRNHRCHVVSGAGRRVYRDDATGLVRGLRSL